MTELPNSVTDAQIKLRHDMRRDTDPRWSLLPVEPIKVRAGARTWHWAALCVAVVCLIAIVRGVQ
jgi:hypothetical protein